MNDNQIQVTDQPSEVDWQRLEDNINQFNMQMTGYHDYRPLVIFLRDPTGAIIAGITAFTWGGTLRILFLWVHENYQRQGYGTQLLEAAEQEAIARGCIEAAVDTHSFQAPQFYPQKGYTVCGVIDDYPVGYQQIVFQKRLR
ncbi:MAG: GNAT family N-acetyltransferase [Ktedonobacteraceae bacterium]